MAFEKLAAYMDSIGEKGAPACDCLVRYKGDTVFRYVCGWADPETGRKASEQDAYWLYSTSKPITCAALLRLVEQGKLSLSDPVSKYLPEFGDLYLKNGKPVKNTLTIYHLFTMCGGLDYALDTPLIRQAAAKSGTTRDIIRAVAAGGLDFEPGTHFQYSLCHDVLGAVSEVITGKSFGEYLQEVVFDPLEMANFGFELTADRLARMSQQYEINEATGERTIRGRENDPYVLGKKYESGGAGLIGTVEDYGKFADAMCRRGLAKNGYRLLQEATVDAMRKNRMEGALLTDFKNRFARPGYGYGLGVRTLIDKMDGSIKSPLGEFGWDGAAGAYVLFDVDHELAIVYAEHVVHHQIAYGEIHPTIRNLVYEELLGE